MERIYLGLGTNLGQKEWNLRMAVRKIEEQVGKCVSLSAFYETAPWGFNSEHSFLNAVMAVDTDYDPLRVLEITQAIERELGRVQKSQNNVYSDRLIDIDLLLFGNRVFTAVTSSGATLTLPHPLMTKRDFVMRPLAEIAPEVVHPVLQRTMAEILAEL